MNYENQIKGDEIIVFADKSLYSKDSIIKCLYWYGNKFHTNISIAQNGRRELYKITLKPLVGYEIDEQTKIETLQKLENDLLDFNLRDIVTKETQNIRDLLIAKAFSNGEFDENPPGEISDPVGFNISDND